jgi:ABC-type transporter Mla MlaB component
VPADDECRPPSASEPDRRAPPSAIVWLVRSGITRSDIPTLCDELAVLLSSASVVVCDLVGVTTPDAVVVEALARLQLTARRLGGHICLDRVSDELQELLVFTGLEAVLPQAERCAATRGPAG